jgi:hypothetical protein
MGESGFCCLLIWAIHYRLKAAIKVKILLAFISGSAIASLMSYAQWYSMCDLAVLIASSLSFVKNLHSIPDE